MGGVIDDALESTASPAADVVNSQAALESFTESVDQVEEEVEEFTNDWGQWLSMGVLPDGRPVAAFYDATEGALGFAIAELGADGSVTWR